MEITEDGNASPRVGPGICACGRAGPTCPCLSLPGVDCGGLDRMDRQGKGRGQGPAPGHWGTGRMQGSGLSIRKGPILKVP